MNQPWYLVGFGVLFAVLGGVFTYIGFDTETPGILWMGWATGGLGSLALFVGLVALGVEIGVRGAER